MKDWGRFYFSFKGRATRSDFNLRFALVALLGSVLAYGLDCLLAGRIVIGETASQLPFSNVFSVLMMVSSFAVTCRRLHDLNASGWWQAGYYALMVGVATACLYMMGVHATTDPAAVQMTQQQVILITATSLFMLTVSLTFFFFLCAKRGTMGPNRFGPDPLQTGDDNDK